MRFSPLCTLTLATLLSVVVVKWDNVSSTGKLYLWSILKLIEGVRWQALMHGFAFYPEMVRGQNKALFVVSQACYFDRKVNDIRKGNAHGMQFPLKFYLNVTDIGKTSFTVSLRWMDSDGKCSVGTFLTKLVYVDKKSRSPLRLPNMFLEIKEVCDRNTNGPYVIPRSETMAIPDTAFQYQTRVLHSDTDMFHHANQASFIRWASDAAALAAVQGNLFNFKRHVELYPFKYMEMQYVGEIVVNREVKVFTWNSPTNPHLIHVTIKSGKLNLWSLSKFFECIRYAALENGFGYFETLKDKDHSIFMASTSYQFTDAGNQLYARHIWGKHFPMYVRLKITHAGSSSFSFRIAVESVKTRHILFTSYMTFVYVDYATRKPSKFPDWYNEKKKLQVLELPQSRLQTPDVPENAFVFHVKSSHADIDHNGHVNQSVYVKWCTDAGTEAALKGHYFGFTENIGKYPMDNFEVKYVSEGFAEECFTVNTWQDKSSPLVLHFVITKHGNVALVAKFMFVSFGLAPRL